MDVHCCGANKGYTVHITTTLRLQRSGPVPCRNHYRNNYADACVASELMEVGCAISVPGSPDCAALADHKRYLIYSYVPNIHER